MPPHSLHSLFLYYFSSLFPSQILLLPGLVPFFWSHLTHLSWLPRWFCRAVSAVLCQVHQPTGLAPVCVLWFSKRCAEQAQLFTGACSVHPWLKLQTPSRPPGCRRSGAGSPFCVAARVKRGSQQADCHLCYSSTINRGFYMII